MVGCLAITSSLELRRDFFVDESMLGEYTLTVQLEGFQEVHLCVLLSIIFPSVRAVYAH